MEEKRCYGCMNLKSNQSVCEHCGYDENMKNEIHQLPAGTVLKEQYMIGRVLGQGGFGITYLGWDMYLDIPVAIKEYFPSGSVMRETAVTMDVVSYSGDVGVRFRNNKERFLREAKMLARFSQVPEIVQIRNFFLANNTAYIVMEYVNGITLKQYVKERGGKLSAKDTLELVEPVIKALAKVHKSGLIHRDISPDNIMMLPEGRIKLLDFGAVRDVGDADVNRPLTKSTEAILKQGYAPIEQYQNRGSLGPWTDVYSLCATIYYCLTGEVPPDAPERLLGDDELDFAQADSRLSEHQAAVLKQGMELRAQERIASMEDLYNQLYTVEVPESDDDTEDTGKTDVVDDDEDTGKTGVVDVPEDIGKTGAIDDNTDSDKKRSSAPKIAAVLLIVAAIVCGIGFANSRKEVKDDEVQKPVEEAVKVIAEGETGEGLQWTLDETGLLLITGDGKMTAEIPWTDHCEQITSVIVGDDVENISANAFMNCKKLENISIGKDTVIETAEDKDGKTYTPFSIQTEENEYKINENLTLHVYKDSPARDFAVEYELYFIYQM